LAFQRDEQQEDLEGWHNVPRNALLGDEGPTGTLGSSSVSNRPSSRYASTIWSDNNGVVYIFGGDGGYSKYSFAIFVSSKYLQSIGWRANICSIIMALVLRRYIRVFA
jgi:hypothetical protein